MEVTQSTIDSLAAKLDALTDAEKVALVLAAEDNRGEVAGFGFDSPQPNQFNYEKIEWVFETFTAPGDVAGILAEIDRRAK